jgi:hypothetical protein
MIGTAPPRFTLVDHLRSLATLASATFGDFFGLSDDSFNYIPANITSIFDLLDEKHVSYACYQESMQSTGFQGFNNQAPDYFTPSSNTLTSYVRKHNPCAFSETFARPARAQRNRNMNDFAADVAADALPQWVFVTPNMENDAHDTGVSFGAKWLQYFLGALVNDKRFNSDRTLIMITFDENETYAVENRIFTAILGNALPRNLIGTTESMYMTHYSMLATVQANWGLQSLGRGDVNRTLANVIPWVAEKTSWTGNADVPAAKRPLLNLTGVYAGPLSNTRNTPFYAPPEQHTKGAGGREALLQPCLDASATADKGALPTPRVGANYYGSQANVGSTDTCKVQPGKGPAGPQPGQAPAGPQPGPPQGPKAPAGPQPPKGPAGPK